MLFSGHSPNRGVNAHVIFIQHGMTKNDASLRAEVNALPGHLWNFFSLPLTLITYCVSINQPGTDWKSYKKTGQHSALGKLIINRGTYLEVRGSEMVRTLRVGIKPV